MTHGDLAAAISEQRRRAPEQSPAPAAPVLALFLRSHLVSPSSPTGQPLFARLEPHVDWLCAFTTPEMLDAYRSATNAPWPTSTHYTGTELVDLACARSIPTGLLLNPASERGSLQDMTLALRPDTLVALANQHP